MAKKKYNAWAIDAIPKEYADIDVIIEDVLFAGLIYFWEIEGGESQTRFQFERDTETDVPYDDQAIKDKWKTIYEELLEAYNWSIRRKEYYESCWEKTGGIYSEVNDKLKIGMENDTAALMSIIKHRSVLWT